MTTSQASASAALPASRAPSRSATNRRRAASTSHTSGVTSCATSIAHVSAPLTAAADHGVRRRLRAAERVRGQNASGSRAQSSDRGSVEHGEQPSVLRVGQEDEAR
jgi:hypothetical protein